MRDPVRPGSLQVDQRQVRSRHRRPRAAPVRAGVSRASACERSVRPFGGEEFCVLLPGCSLADARQRCEQLRTAIATVATDANNAGSTVSASFGVAATSSSGYELRQLLAHADAALYRAKYAGRNCVVLYDTMHTRE